MKLFAIFKGEEYLGSIKSFNGSNLRSWASEFYNCSANLLKIYEMVEVR